MERRKLATGIHSIPNADPQAVRQFVTQGSDVSLRESTRPASPPPQASLSEASPVTSHSPRRSSVAVPVGLIPVTVRLRPELAGALKRASLERQLAGERPSTQQELVELALEPWLRAHGYV